MLRKLVGSSSPFADRFPPPATQWTLEYLTHHSELVAHVLDDPDLLGLFASDGKLPRGYGVGYDERVVEYPWLFAQQPAERTLDAGSTLNREDILERILPRLGRLHVVTLAPEPLSYTDLGVSYVYADLRDLPYREGYFDTIVSLSTLEHVGMDNTKYGAARETGGDPRAALRQALAELERVLAPNGKILVSVPYGAREDHGWLRQFDAEDVQGLVSAATAVTSSVAVFAYSSKGWQRSSLEGAAGAQYRNYLEYPEPVEDLAAAARAVACIRLDYGSS
jgi:SAM-dependent methyltransferase